MALQKLRTESSVSNEVFVLVPQFDRKKKAIAPNKLIFADRLRTLCATVKDMRTAEARHNASVQSEQTPNKSDDEAVSSPMKSQTPNEPRKHDLTPRVFWHCDTPPAYIKPSQMPANPQRLLLENVTYTSAVLRWERPSSDCDLLYTVRISEDRGRTFTRVATPIRQRFYHFTDLNPDCLYYVTVTSTPIYNSNNNPNVDSSSNAIPPVIASSPLFSARKLARRPRKLLHFYTLMSIRPPDRFCATPDVHVYNKYIYIHI
jgi:hypothetical protein